MAKSKIVCQSWPAGKTTFFILVTATAVSSRGKEVDEGNITGRGEGKSGPERRGPEQGQQCGPFIRFYSPTSGGGRGERHRSPCGTGRLCRTPGPLRLQCVSAEAVTLRTPLPGTQGPLTAVTTGSSRGRP